MKVKVTVKVTMKVTVKVILLTDSSSILEQLEHQNAVHRIHRDPVLNRRNR